MTQDSHLCPRCGEVADGLYCGNCGASLAQTPCPACRTTLTPGARFCHGCGLPMGKKTASVNRGRVPIWVWPTAVAGTAVIFSALFLWAKQESVPRDPSTGAPVAQSNMPDLSQMTPRQQADRLFDRIIRAAEQENMEEIDRFRPMALAAYAMLGGLDEDARYHVGLIHALSGETEEANAQVDSLRMNAPNHLLAEMLQYTIAQVSGDNSRLESAKSAFLENYEEEVARVTPEYQAHREAIDAFRSAAQSDAGRN